MIEQLHHDGYNPLFRLVSLAEEGIIIGLITNGNTFPVLKNQFVLKNTEGVKAQVAYLCQRLKAIGYDDQRIEEITDHAIKIELMECDAFEYAFVIRETVALDCTAEIIAEYPSEVLVSCVRQEAS